jgi:hypothetical protein
MKPRTRSATAVMLIAGGLTLAACTPGSGPEPEPALGPIPVVRTAADIVLPLDAYRFTNEVYTAKVRAQGRLVADCMQRFGVTYPTGPDTLTVGVDVPDFDHLDEHRYGLMDAVSAAERGYGAPGQPAEQQPPAKQQAQRRGGLDLTPHMLFLLSGKTRPEFADAKAMPVDANGKRLSDDGCAGDSERALAGGPRVGDLALAQTLATETYHRAENDSRVRAASTAWSTCMSEHGYRYSSIWEPADLQWPRPVGPEEIATAVADVGCKLSTNLAGIWLAVETAYQNREIDRNAQRLADVDRYLKNVGRNSARVVGG